MKRLLTMCFNWKVIVGLAIACLGIVVVAPGLLSRALPVVFFAACPISMLVMMATTRQPAAQIAAPEDVNSLHAQLAELTAHQDQVREHLARLASSQPQQSEVESHL